MNDHKLESARPRHHHRFMVGALALVLPLASGACSTSANVPQPSPAADAGASAPPEVPNEPEPPSAPTLDPTETTTADPVDETTDESGEFRSPGDAPATACNTKDDCPSAHVCEGQGCGDLEGRCAPPDRMCTRDLRTYCSCDGETFRGSGSCPGRRYSREGPCDGTAPAR